MHPKHRPRHVSTGTRLPASAKRHSPLGGCALSNLRRSLCLSMARLAPANARVGKAGWRCQRCSDWRYARRLEQPRPARQPGRAVQVGSRDRTGSAERRQHNGDMVAKWGGFTRVSPDGYPEDLWSAPDEADRAVLPNEWGETMYRKLLKKRSAIVAAAALAAGLIAPVVSTTASAYANSASPSANAKPPPGTTNLCNYYYE